MLRGKRRVSNKASATNAFDAVSVFPRDTYVANVAKETYKKIIIMQLQCNCNY